MKIPPVLLLFLLPYTTIAYYDESSTRKINLEDIEDEHIQNERQSKSFPPPLSKQPAKGQPVELYPTIPNEHYPYDNHHFLTRAHQHVQPLTDQPTAPEAGYQQSPAYHDESIVYGQPQHLQPGGLHQQQHQLYEGEGGQQQEQQPGPHFYYSHDVPPQHEQPSGNGNDYQIQFVPIDQHGGSGEQQQQQHSYHGPSQVTVPSTAAPAQPVSYSHNLAYDEDPQSEAQQQQLQHHYQQHEPSQYPSGNEIRAPNYLQHVYGLPADVLFHSERDIEYARPADSYGPPSPPLQYFKKEEYSQRDYSQDVTTSKPTTTPSPNLQPPKVEYPDEIKSVEYQSPPAQPDSSASSSQTSYRPKPKTSQQPAFDFEYESQLALANLGPSEKQAYYLNHQKEFKHNQRAQNDNKPLLSDGYKGFPTPTESPTPEKSYLNSLKEFNYVYPGEVVQKPSIAYGPPDSVGKQPHIEYGVPDAPFRRPVAQSNQDVYAPRRPSSAGRSYEKSFAVSFPYPPSFVTITTESPSDPTSFETVTTEKPFDPPPVVTTTSEKFTNRPMIATTTTEMPTQGTTTAEPSLNNEVNPWRPIHVKPSQQNQYRSFGQNSKPCNDEPLVDFFESRHAKSLLDSYIPSWLVTQMQEEHARRGHENYPPPPPHPHPTHHYPSQPPHPYPPHLPPHHPIPHVEVEVGYNTIPYVEYENLYDHHYKRSIQKKEKSPQKLVSSEEEMTAME